MRILKAIEGIKGYDVQLEKAIKEKDEFIKNHPEDHEEAEKLTQKVWKILDLRDAIVNEYAKPMEDEIFYTFNFKEFPRETLPEDTLKNSFFQTTELERITDDDVVIVEAWDQKPNSILQTFQVTLDEFKKYFKEVKTKEEALNNY